MPKVFVGLLFVVALSAQVTTIPAAAGGGGGPITAGRVAFGDGTSTAATDSQFVWDNTNKRFQVGTFSIFSGLEPYVQATLIRQNTTAYGTYQDLYGFIGEYRYGDPAMGATSGDVYAFGYNARLTGNASLTSAGGGITGANLATTLQDSADASYVYGLYNTVQLGDPSNTATTVTGLYSRLVSEGTISTAYGIRSSFSGGGTATNKWDISAETGWASRFLGKVAIGESNSAAPTSTLYVKDATASTGATTVQFDIGAGQSSTSTILTLGGVVRFNGQNTTGAGIASLGSNSPAVTNTSPYTWIRIVTSDGSTAYIPAWK